MAKQKIIEKITIGGFLLWMMGCTIRTILIMVASIISLIPYINVFLNRQWYLYEVLKWSEDNLWDRCKTKFKIVKEEKIIRQVLERV